jgi:SAM-dependent methyltransferase/energy-converting hydrogenase Eha subunit A
VTEDEATEKGAENSGRVAFLAASFLSLFLEVLLIRWCGAEIRILAYLKNLTLLGCFLGLGLGYALTKKRRLGVSASFLAILLIVVLAHPALGGPLRSLSLLLNFSDLNSWKSENRGGLEAVMGLGLLSLLYALLAFSFVPLGQSLGAYFAALPKERRVREYTWNVVASLLGIAAFGTLSLQNAPPLAWFVLAGAAALLAARTLADRALVTVLAAATAFLIVYAEKSPSALEGDVAPLTHKDDIVETTWSPYQKIQLVRETYAFTRPVHVTEGPPSLAWDDYSAYVNGHWYSRVGNVDLAVAALRASYAENPTPLSSQQLLRLPHELATGRKRVLLLGSGMGRDAATALDEGWDEIDCVEIEGRFIEWGKELNPQKPYTNPHVHVHVDDARRFLRTAPSSSYDLVVFCYLDSHSLTSNFTNTNLDSYVYTRESLAEAKRLLDQEHGVLALGFWSPRDFIYRRLDALLSETFGAPPFRMADGSLFLTGVEHPKKLQERVLAKPHLRDTLFRAQPHAPESAIEPTTDDWPFFYLESRSVPLVVLVVLVAIALLSAGGIRAAFGPWKTIDRHFLLLGAAFMLVETWAISRASLVYGATWYVSSAVIASLLVAILLANTYVERRGPVRFSWAFPGLALALLLATLVDPSHLLGLPRAAQLAIAAPLYAVPFLFASAIFASSFARTERADAALASNLMGSVLGGGLECLSYATGLRSLGFVALALYLLAWAAARPVKDPSSTP